MKNLILTGQLRVKTGEEFSGLIDNFKRFVKPDRILLVIWEEDYETYCRELEWPPEILLKVIARPEYPSSLVTSLPGYETPYRGRAESYFYQFYGLQIGFSWSIEIGAHFHVRCRYDNRFDKPLDWGLVRTISVSSPCTVIPFGGDYHSGLGDIFYIMDTPSASIMSNYWDRVVDLCRKGAPLHPEYLFRNVLFGNTNLYRISFPVSLRDGTFRYFNEHFFGPFFFRDVKPVKSPNDSGIFSIGEL